MKLSPEQRRAHLMGSNVGALADDGNTVIFSVPDESGDPDEIVAMLLEQMIEECEDCQEGKHGQMVALDIHHASNRLAYQNAIKHAVNHLAQNGISVSVMNHDAAKLQCLSKRGASVQHLRIVKLMTHAGQA